MPERALSALKCDGSGGGVIVVGKDGVPMDGGVERLPDLCEGTY